MKKILFLTLSNFEDVNKRGIYTDLVRTLAEKCEVFVVSPRERKTELKTELSEYQNIKILKVRTGNITKCSIIEKGISSLRIEEQYLRSIKNKFEYIKFDMIVYCTPPITFLKIVEYFKKKDDCVSYLILKDIFPQNAVDIGLLKKDGFIHKYFRRKEEKLYTISDYIGCMSEANVKYVIEHNPEIIKDNVEVLPNSIIPIEKSEIKDKDVSILEKYNIPYDSVLFVYGGNLGKPQGIDFVIEVAKNFYRVEKGFLLIVGSGTEYPRLKEFYNRNKPKNCSLYSLLPKHEYDQLINNADVGLIFLDKRFTIPNFPSRLTAYMEYSIPVLAATDKNTDIKDVIINSGSGLWSESGDINSFIGNANILASNPELRIEMGLNARKFLEENYDVRRSVDRILEKL